MNYDKLELAGIDIPELMNRLMNNEQLIGLFIRKFLSDENYNNLVTAMSSSDMALAESASHTLKGMCGNLSLKKLFALLTEQIRFIRQGDYDSALSMMAQISDEYKNAAFHMNMWLEENK